MKIFSDIQKTNELCNVYDQIDCAVRNLLSLGIATDNYHCLFLHILKGFVKN